MAKAPQTILGEEGGKLIENVSSHSGVWNAIQMLEDSTFTTLTATNDDAVGGTLGNITFTAGVIIFGHFTTIQLATGAVRAYNSG